MAYYEDLSEYIYHNGMFFCPGTSNVGWLALGHEFNKAEPSAKLLECLWNFCKISVAQTRGIHECEFCMDDSAYRVVRNGERLLLGNSEIRVFSRSGDIYAAPTLVYHYVAQHQYVPPDEFLRALDEGPAPPAQAYFERLNESGLAWNKTSTSAGERMTLR